MTAQQQRRATVRPITDGEFGLFQALIHREAGIYISPAQYRTKMIFENA